MAGKKKPPYASLEEAGANYVPPSWGDMLATQGNPHFAALMAARDAAANTSTSTSTSAPTSAPTSAIIETGIPAELALTQTPGTAAQVSDEQRARGLAANTGQMKTIGNVLSAANALGQPTGLASAATLAALNAGVNEQMSRERARVTPPFNGPPAPAPAPAQPVESYYRPWAQLGAPQAQLQAQLGALPQVAAQQVQPGQAQAPTPQDVQGQLEDPRIRALRAPSVGDIQYTAPDFLARPDGEAMLEDFAFRQMLVMGDNAPKALQQQWGNIQQAKMARLGARANYFADLIKERHKADLQRRNQSDVDQAADTRAALDRVADIRKQSVQLRLQADIANARARQQAAAANAGAQAALLKGATGALSPKQASFIAPKLDAMRAQGHLLQRLDEFGAKARELEGIMGMGDLSRGIVWGGKFLGYDKATAFNTIMNELELERVMELAKAAGARSIDSDAERAKLRDAFVNSGNDLTFFLKRIEETKRKVADALRGTGQIVDRVDTYGQSGLNTYNDIYGILRNAQKQEVIRQGVMSRDEEQAKIRARQELGL